MRFVRHRYGKGKRRRVCIRCGTRRRYRMSDWEWKAPHAKTWSITNPPCVKRAVTDESKR